MRFILATAATAAVLAASTASAVTITNLEQSSVRIFVCDQDCGPSHGDDWGSARDFTLSAGEAKSFDCKGKCFVGVFADGESPSLGDMAMADDDELFSGVESGYIRNGGATHKSN